MACGIQLFTFCLLYSNTTSILPGNDAGILQVTNLFKFGKGAETRRAAHTMV